MNIINSKKPKTLEKIIILLIQFIFILNDKAGQLASQTIQICFSGNPKPSKYLRTKSLQSIGQCRDLVYNVFDLNKILFGEND